ncbi:hypothetical protein ZWY2020_034069 [Hordeum vulgare]|nr:hypothetical protein ZWY2020_034069 [Hordeum vulgare]
MATPPAGQAAVFHDSGSNSDEAARALELTVVRRHADAIARGCSPTHQAPPRSTRRRSQEECTPLASPPLSCTTVLLPSPVSKRTTASASPRMGHAPSQALLELCAPMSLLQPLRSPSRPPGFQASPTPPLLCCDPLRHTPSPTRGNAAANREEVLTHL